MGTQLLATLVAYGGLYGFILLVGRLSDIKNSIQGQRHLLRIALRLAIVFVIAATPCVLLGVHPLLIIGLLLILPIVTAGPFGETLLGFPVLLIYSWITMQPGISAMSLVTLTDDQSSSTTQAKTSDHNSEMIGKVGTTRTVLRPYGVIQIDGNSTDAKAQSGLIQANTRVSVIREEGGIPIVKESTQDD